jgi:hypothetical protein
MSPLKTTYRNLVGIGLPKADFVFKLLWSCRRKQSNGSASLDEGKKLFLTI